MSSSKYQPSCPGLNVLQKTETSHSKVDYVPNTMHTICALLRFVLVMYGPILPMRFTNRIASVPARNYDKYR